MINLLSQYYRDSSNTMNYSENFVDPVTYAHTKKDQEFVLCIVCLRG